jgi:hypothetical protein
MDTNQPAQEQAKQAAEERLPATREAAPLVLDTIHDMHPDHRDPQHQDVQQNVGVALLPLALIMLLVLTFIAAAWTVLAAQPPAV